MEMVMQNSREIVDWGQPIWLAILASASVASSLGLACAIPLGAFAALGALTMDRLSALAMIALVVLANQSIGFAVLHYPLDISTFAWGPVFARRCGCDLGGGLGRRPLRKPQFSLCIGGDVFGGLYDL